MAGPLGVGSPVVRAGGAASLAALAGCTTLRSRVDAVAADLPFVGSGSGPGTVGGSLPAAVEREGGYDVIVPGSDSEAILTHHYRSDTGPLRRASDVGGVTEVVPEDGGVRLVVDLTPDDVFGAAGVQVGPVYVDDIAEIRFEATDDIVVALPLGIANNGETIGEWESVEPGLQRWVGFDGDDRVLSDFLSADASPIARSERRFGSPPNGGAGPLSDVSIVDIQAEFGNVPVRVAASVHARPGESRRTVVETLEVALRD